MLIVVASVIYPVIAYFSYLSLPGLMESITGLETGLQYLGLSGCRLKAQELQTLATSRHGASLLQLDISENSAKGKPDMYQGYVELFASLKTVRRVEMVRLG